MSTNFYWYGHEHDDSIEYHIGKRSFAGVYCYDCGTTLCADGTVSVHDPEAIWYKTCPSCGKPDSELRAAHSFIWTLMKHRKRLEQMAQENTDAKAVVDEYGRTYTAAEFLELVNNCVIQSQVPLEFC